MFCYVIAKFEQSMFAPRLLFRPRQPLKFMWNRKTDGVLQLHLNTHIARLSVALGSFISHSQSIRVLRLCGHHFNEFRFSEKFLWMFAGINDAQVPWNYFDLGCPLFSSA